jgi:hypothetical protein
MRAKAVICGILALALLTGGCKKRYPDLTTDLHRAAEKAIWRKSRRSSPAALA